MPSIKSLLGDSLVNNSGGEVSSDSVSGPGKVVGLYFSAHWCPPCRGFTPKLVEWYNKFKAGDKGALLEMVFVSSDRSDDTFKEYFGEMPWLALPFSDRERKAHLSRKFKVQGIPTLVFLDGSNGKLITDDGRSRILEDPEGKDFPWHPKPISALLEGTLKSPAGDVDAVTALQGKVKGLYFSAHWCPPCRAFTPDLVNVYEKIREQGKNFEIVFVSSDRSQSSYDEYCATMPWLSVPFGDERKSALEQNFSISGIPTLVLLDEDNKIITQSGRAMVMKDPEGKDFPWHPKPLDELNDFTGPTLNESACLVYFTDGNNDEVEKAKGLLEPVANEYKNALKQSENDDEEIPELVFLYEGLDGDDVVESVRNFAMLEDRNPLLVILDIPGQRLFAQPDGDLTPEVISKVVEDYKADRLSWRPLR